MTSSWSERKLGDLIQINPDALNKTYPYSEIEYLDISSVGTGYYTETCHLKLEEAPSRAKRLVSDGDTIISTVRPGNKSYCYLKKTTPRMVVSTGFAVLRAKKDLLDERFLYYLVSNPAFTEYLVAHEKGAAYPAVGTETIENAIVNIPDLPTQKKISDILGSLDDKIELNRRMNETLEQMAMALYKHWFVDFGPFQDGELEDSPIGAKPKNWDVAKLRDLIELAYGKALKAEDRKGGPYPVYGSSGVVGWHNEYIADGPGIIVGRKGNIGTVHLSHTGFYPIDTTYYVKSNLPDLNPVYYFYYLLQSLGLSHMNNDSAVPGLNRETVYNLDIVIPPNDLICEFDSKVEIFHMQINQNNSEIDQLSKVRDYLLPRLLSGEIEVREAEEQVEEVLANA
jgi:Restriction endonuclease S subunits